VVGGVAVNLHRYIRMTTDLDIVLEMSDENIRNAISILKACGFTVKIPVDPMGLADSRTRAEWMRRKNLKAINFWRRSGRDQIDVIVASPVRFETLQLTRFRVRGTVYPAASKPDLIRMKRETGRDVDARDVEQLKRLIRLEQPASGKARNSPRRSVGRRRRGVVKA